MKLKLKSSPKVTVDEITSVSTVQPSTSAGTLPFLYQCQVGTVNIFTNSQNPKGSDFEKTHQFKRRRIVIDSSDESQQTFLWPFFHAFFHISYTTIENFFAPLWLRFGKLLLLWFNYNSKLFITYHFLNFTYTFFKALLIFCHCRALFSSVLFL